jgi:hypothetical protein
MGKWLILSGVILIIAGLLFSLKIPFLGKMPGDIVIKGENYAFYFPIVTCLIISIVLSLIFYVFSK